MARAFRPAVSEAGLGPEERAAVGFSRAAPPPFGRDGSSQATPAWSWKPTVRERADGTVLLGDFTQRSFSYSPPPLPLPRCFILHVFISNSFLFVSTILHFAPNVNSPPHPPNSPFGLPKDSSYASTSPPPRGPPY